MTRPTPKREARLRPIEASHIGDLIRLGNETDLSPWTANSYLEELKNPSAIMIRLADDDNSTLGFIVGRTITGGEIEMSRDAEIYNVAVRKDRHRQGHGQHLLDAFVDKCREKGVVNIWLEVRRSNLGAISFYEKNGFEYVQSRQNFYDNPREHGWLMRRVLKY